MEIDLIGNDMYLAIESQYDLLASLRGAYSKLYFLEREKEDDPLSKATIERINERSFHLSETENKLLGADISEIKVSIKSMASELMEVNAEIAKKSLV